MKVVILHQHFNLPTTGGGIRSWYLAKALIENGIDVIVITAHNQKKYLKILEDGIEIHYLPVPYDNKFGFGARSTSFLRFAWQSFRLFKQLKDASLCYAISVPLTTGLSALMTKKRFNIPFLFEVGDLWPDAPVQMDFIKNYFFKKFLYRLEKYIYQSASAIVALSAPIQIAVNSRVAEKKIYLIPNMSDCDYFAVTPKDQVLEKKFDVEGKFVVSYTGAIGIANGLDYFLECANLARRHNLPIRFLLCGDGALRERLVRHAKQMDIPNLSFIDFQNRAGVKQILNVTDAAFVSYKRVPILETGSPNKFFDGLAAGKLMIINFGGWIKKEIEENECGFYANPDQPMDFIEKITTFLNDEAKLQRYQTASRNLAERKYTRRMLSEKFVALVKENVQISDPPLKGTDRAFIQ